MAFSNCDCPERVEVLNSFYQQWQHEALVLDKWFAIQARSDLPDTFAQVKKLLNHPAFNIKNPNRVRSLVAVFCNENLVQFHAMNGEGYEFLADHVIKIDQLNPQLAARLVHPLTFWQKQNDVRQKHMRQQLERIVNTKPISTDVYELASKSLV
jgi:aminopeptidase N